MPTVLLDESRQAALSALLALEPATGDRLLDRRVLEETARLIPCNAISLGDLDTRTGVPVRSVSLPPWMSWLHPHETVDGRCPEGVHHQLDDPRLRPLLRRTGMSDGLLLCFRDGRDRVVQVWLDRRHRRFTDADTTLLRVIAPALRRLLRDGPAARLRVDLTAQERRVLRLVATGMSNADVAAQMSVAPCTVRKHLEHTFRKLGVSNRLAAVQAYEGRPSSASGREQTFA